MLPTNWNENLQSASTGIYFTSLVANDNILAVGYKESKIELVDISGNNIVWASNQLHTVQI